MSGYVDHAWRHRPKASGGTDPIETTNVVPWASLVGSSVTISSGTSYNIDDLATSLAYGSNDTSHVYFSDFSDSSLGYTRHGIEIHYPGVYLFDWGVYFGFGASGGPLYLVAYPNATTGALSAALSSSRTGWNANYDYLTTSAAYGTTREKHLGGGATLFKSSSTTTRYPIRIESFGASANWTINTTLLHISRLGDYS